MSRPNKPWFRKSNRRWYVWFDGRQLNLGPDRAAAHQRFYELMAQPKSSCRVPTTSEISLAEVVDHFLGWVQQHRAPDTYEWYRYRLERLCQAYPRLIAEQLRPFHVDDWVSRYELSVTSRRNYLRSAKRCYKWARRQGHLTENPIADLEVPSAEAKEILVDLGEFERLLEFVKNPDLADLIRVTWETGCRPQESLRVEARHVDVANQRWVFGKSESKGKKSSRVVYMTDVAMSIVVRLIHEYPEGPIFRNVNGKPWTTEAVNCGFGAVQIRMGRTEMKSMGIEVTDEAIEALIPALKPMTTVKGKERDKRPAELRCEAKRKLTNKLATQHATRYSLYALRHSFATNALQKGIDSLTVAVLLGHDDPSTLARVYQHLNQNPKHLLDEIRKAAG
jgi:integrase